MFLFLVYRVQARRKSSRPFHDEVAQGRGGEELVTPRSGGRRKQFQGEGWAGGEGCRHHHEHTRSLIMHIPVVSNRDHRRYTLACLKCWDEARRVFTDHVDVASTKGAVSFCCVRFLGGGGCNRGTAEHSSWAVDNIANLLFLV